SKAIGDAIAKADEEVKRDPAKAMARAAKAAKKAGSLLPPVPSPDAIASAGGVVQVVDELRGCITLAQTLIEQSRDKESGRVRLPKTALAASEHLRKCLETAVKLA